MSNLNIQPMRGVATNIGAQNSVSLDNWVKAVPAEIKERKQAAKNVKACINALETRPANRRSFVSLDLDGLNLSDINFGREIFQQLSLLPNLFLQYNRLTSLPQDIELCKNMTLLDCHDNPLEQCPDALKHCRKLQTLNMSNAQLSEIPIEIFSLSRLHTLKLENNNIAHIEDTFLFGSCLLELNLDNNKLTALPEFIKNLDAGVVSAEGNPVASSALLQKS